MIITMYMMICVIPVVTILLSGLYILNDRIAKRAEQHTDRYIIWHNESACNSPRCNKATLLFI